jgi:hypothetical protein
VSRVSADMLRELLTQSLIAWRLTGSVECTPDGAVLLACNEVDIRIERAAPELPFRWMVTIAGRRRVAISLPAVLRQAREALDPGYERGRVRVAVEPPEHDPEKWEPVFGRDRAQAKSLPS